MAGKNHGGNGKPDPIDEPLSQDDEFNATFEQWHRDQESRRQRENRNFIDNLSSDELEILLQRFKIYRDHSNTQSADQGTVAQESGKGEAGSILRPEQHTVIERNRAGKPRYEGDRHSHLYPQRKEPEPKSDFIQTALKWVAFATLLAGSFAAGMKVELIEGKPYIFQRVIPLHRDFCEEIHVSQGETEKIYQCRLPEPLW